MKGSSVDQTKEFQNLVGDLSQTITQMSDPVAIGAMLYNIAEEKRSGNLVLKELNVKFENILEQLQKISSQLAAMSEQKTAVENAPHIKAGISERDEEVLSYVREQGKVCADTMQEKFQYKGRNAASARLSKLFKDGLLDKTYVGRNVYYTIK